MVDIIHLNGREYLPQMSQDDAGSWERVLVLMRHVAQKELRQIMQQFAWEPCNGGPGGKFVRPARIRRVGRDLIIFAQRGGYDT